MSDLEKQLLAGIFALAVLLLTAVGWMIRRYLGEKKLQAAQTRNQIADAEGKDAARIKTTYETKKIIDELERAEADGELENSLSFIDKVERLLNRAEEKAAQHALERKEDDDKLRIIRNLLDDAEKTIKEQAAHIERQRIISDHEEKKAEVLKTEYAGTIQKLNQITEKYEKVLTERNDFESKYNQSRSEIAEIQEKLEVVSAEVFRLQGIMHAHNIPTTTGVVA